MRECDGCNLCCKMLAISEPGILEKTDDELCPHWGEGGCKIYESRCNTCRKYKCLWLRGILPDVLKPSKSNVLFDRFMLHPNRKVYMVGFTHAITDEIEKLAYNVCGEGISVCYPVYDDNTSTVKYTYYDSTSPRDPIPLIKYSIYHGILTDISTGVFSPDEMKLLWEMFK